MQGKKAVPERKAAKAAALALTAGVAAIALFAGIDPQEWGLRRGCPAAARAAYPFLHANVFHAAANLWCLLSAVFLRGAGLRGLAAAYAVAVSVPGFLLSEKPVVGMSGMVFALFGILSARTARKARYHAWMCACIGAGFLLPAVCGTVHLYCYAAGTICAELAAMAQRTRNGKGYR